MVTLKKVEDVIEFSDPTPSYEWVKAFVEGVGEHAADEERKAHATSYTHVRLEKTNAMLEEYQFLLRSALEIMTPEQRRALLVTAKSNIIPLSLPQHHSRNA